MLYVNNISNIFSRFRSRMVIFCVDTFVGDEYKLFLTVSWVAPLGPEGVSSCGGGGGGGCNEYRASPEKGR